MEDKDSQTIQNVSASGLYMCPHCACCFCSEADLKEHMKHFGDFGALHKQEFQKVHGRLEHGSFGGPE